MFTKEEIEEMVGSLSLGGNKANTQVQQQNVEAEKEKTKRAMLESAFKEDKTEKIILIVAISFIFLVVGFVVYKKMK